MSGYSRLLLRQLARLHLEPDGPVPTPQQWRNFLDNVDRAYADADEHRYLLERSQTISSQEMQQLYSRLQEAQRIAGIGNWSFETAERQMLWSEECARLFDLDPQTASLSYRHWWRRVCPKDRTRLKQALRRAFAERKAFELELRLRLAGAETRWINIIGEPAGNETSTPARLLGTVIDISRRKFSELRQAIEHSTTLLLAQADENSPDEVMPRIIASICSTLGWQCGAFWHCGGVDGDFIRTAIWARPETEAAGFYRVTPNSMHASGSTDIITCTAHRGEPVWIDDVSHDEKFSERRPAAAQYGLRASFALPVQANGETIGVLELFNNEPQHIDRYLLQSAHFVGRQLAQFFQRKQAEGALRESEAHFRALVEQASDGFYLHDVDGRIAEVNQRACDALGYSRDELLRMNITDIDLTLTLADLQSLQPQLAAHVTISLESHHLRKDGSIFPVEIRLGMIEITGRRRLLSLVRDITERKQMQDRIQRLAYHDSLTGLPNRTQFSSALGRALIQAQRYNKRLALLFADLDHFKDINDSLGHDAGDRLLKEMANRLTACHREGDLVARLGGDEFVILIEEIADTAYAGHVARKILNALVEGYSLEGQLIHMSASIGISTFPEDGHDERTLMMNADIAMYRAKRSGKNTYRFYSTDMNKLASELLARESALRRAPENE